MIIPDVFSIVPIECCMDKRLTLKQFRVLVAILSFRSKNTDLVWPSRNALADRTGMLITNISAATRELVDLGWLVKIGNGGRSMATRYRVTVPEIVAKTVSGSETVSAGKTVSDSDTVSESETVSDSDTKTVSESDTGKEETSEYTKNLITFGSAANEKTGELTGFENQGGGKKQIIKPPAKRASAFPEKFKPDDSIPALADELGVSLSGELHRFADYHRAKGSVMKDWQAALRNWLRNAASYAEKSKASAGKCKGKFDPLAYVNRSANPGSRDADNAIDADYQRVA